MTLIEWAILTLVGVVALYFVVRIVSIAFFRTKLEFQRMSNRELNNRGDQDGGI